MSKKKRKASCSHCRKDPDCCAEARRVPIGFVTPKSVEARGPFPLGIESQAWEAMHE